MKRLLFVDDSPQILNAIKRIFFETEYEVFTAGSGKEAMAIMEEKEINLIVSDVRMPDMDGYQLLSIVKKKYPSAIRIILSGYADEKKVIEALRNNIAKVYLFKPWNNEVLLKLVEQLFQTEALLQGDHVLAMVNNPGVFSTIRSSHSSILRLIEQEAEIVDITRAIERDQTIATQILRIANSAYYGLRTGSVKQAVQYLGLNTMRSLVLVTPLVNAADSSDPKSKFIIEQLEIALYTNRILSFLYERFLHKKVDEMSNVAGLLHNMGRSLLASVYKNEYVSFYSEAIKSGKDMLEAERENFKATHMEAGGSLLQWWDLPFPLVEAALYHHDPFDERAVNRELIQAVHVAQHYAMDSLGSDENAPFFSEVFDALGIDKEKFDIEIELELEKWKKII